MIKTKILPLLFILLLNPILAIAGEWEDLNAQVIEAYSAGEYDRAAVLAEQALKLANKTFGRKHPDTLTSLNNLAFLYKGQGRYKQAEPLYIETVALSKEILGLKHPSTLTSMNNLALLYKAQGRYEQAEPLYIETLALSKEILGLKHPDTLTSMNNLAFLYNSQGRYEQAEPLYSKTLALSKEILGLKHPDTLTSMNNLAFLYNSQGRYEQAEPLYSETLALSKEILGLRHPDTLLSMNNLASLYQNQGRYEQAEPLYSETLALSKEILGLKHPSTLISINNLATLYDSQGRYEQAEPLSIETLALSKEILGLKHPSTLLSMSNLAGLYDSQGRYEQAEPLYIETLALRKEILGLRHPDTLLSINNLAVLYNFLGRYEQAEPLYIETLALQKEILGLKHPDTLLSMNNLALLYENQGRYEQAEPLYIETLALRKEILGLKHPRTLTTMSNLAELYRAQGRYEQAEPLYIETLALQKEILGLKHPDTLISMNNLTELYYNQGRYKQAESVLIETLGLRKEILGLKHPNTLSTMNNLAKLYIEQERYEQAEPLSTETLALSKEIKGLKHPDTLISMNNLATLYDAQGRYEQAEPLYAKTLTLSKEILGLKHPSTLLSMSNLAGLYQATQQWKQAQTLWDEYLTLSNQFLNQVLWGAGEKTRVSYIQQQKPFRNIILSFYSHLLANSPSQYNNTAPFSDFDPKQISQQAWRVSISRKGLLLRIASEISALSKVHQSSNPQLIQLSEQVKHARSQLATLAFSAKPNPKQQAELEELLNTLQRQLGAKVSSFRNKVTNVSPEHILSALKAQQAIVDFMVFKEIDLKTLEYKTEQVIALLAVPNQGVQLIKLGALEPISQLIQSYRSAIEPNPYNDAWFTSNERKQTLEQTSKALYQKLWQPLIHALGDKQQVFLIPDGILHLLPFKALQDEQGQYLNQKIQITRLGSAREIVIPPLNNKTSTSTIFANPVYAKKSAELSTNAGKNRTVSRSLRGLEFSPLPGTKTESESIQQTLQNMQQPVKLYSQLNATEMAIRQEKSPRILHIATHGFFLENIKVPEGTGKTGRVQFSKSGKAGLTNVENPLARSGLALTYANQGISGINQADGSDGILTAMEVLNLQLEGTELVTLSACNTGVGEGVYSLNRAFQEAGAKAVLSTLWSISDEGTNHFMQKFYHRFLNNQPPQQALQETQDELKDSKKWQDPFFWAPFVMMGQ